MVLNVIIKMKTRIYAAPAVKGLRCVTRFSEIGIIMAQYGFIMTKYCIINIGCDIIMELRCQDMSG